MKKIILILLCFVLLLCGCEKLQKAEPYFTETREDVVLSAQYEYYFDDERRIRCIWKNESSEALSFYDTFELHVLGDDGEWYRIMDNEAPVFNTKYCHGIDPESESGNRYDISVYTDKLDEGKTYRISTFFFDDNGNNYQVFAEFICDNELAEKEMEKVSGGEFNTREDPSFSGKFEILEKENG